MGLAYVWLTRENPPTETVEYRMGRETPPSLRADRLSSLIGDRGLRLARLPREAPVSIPLSEDFLKRILSADDSAVTVALPGGGSMKGRVTSLRRDDNGPIFIEGVVTAPEAGKFMFQRQTVPGKAGSMVGFIHYDKSETAYKVSPLPESGEPALFKTNVGEVICRAFPPRNGPAEIPPTHPTDYPIPPGENGIIQLQSLPGATAVVYLDYDGEERNFDLWGYINAQPFPADAAQIFHVWKGVSEDFQPFNINVTTIRAVYDSAPEGRRMHVVVTPTDTASPGAGGVAYVGSYNWSGAMVCWAFFGTGKDAVEIISHEVGHTLGLSHHGTPEDEYYEGHPGWAPIMGVGYYQIPSQWSKGEYPDAFANNGTEEGLQDDLAIITTANNDVAYRADDHGDTFATATWLEIDAMEEVSNEGAIETAADEDSFRFSTAGGTLSLQIDPVADHPNLDLKAEILDSGGTLIAAHEPQNSKAAFFSALYLIAGDYSLRVSGVGRGDLVTGYSDYASLGAYTITGSINGGVPADRFSIPENSPAATIVGTVAPRVSHGAGVLSYAILSGNTGATFAINPLTGEITVDSDLLLDFESLSTRWDDPAVFELFVEITDDLLVATETIRTVITITNVNEAPDFPTPDAVLLAEQTAIGTEVTTVTATDPDRGDYVLFSIEAGNTGGAFAMDAATGTLTVAGLLDFETTPSYSLTLRATDQLIPANSVEVTLTINLLDLAEDLAPGGVMQTIFEDIPGHDVESLTLSPAFPGKPHSERFLGSFDSGASQGDSYGSTVRGHLIAPATGDYTFWISADHAGELIISTDDAPENSVLRASINTPSNRAEWEKFGSQESSPIALVAGQIYYIEARHKESTGGDHIQVAWQGPGTGGRGIIPGRWLIPFEENHAPWALDATLTVRESAENGQYVGSLNFIEPDEGESITAYVITGGNESGVFSIDSNTGAITLADAAGIAAGDTWTLGISATDNGIPALTGHATAHIIARGLDEGLHTWWKLDELSGMDVPDSSGNHRDAVLDGGAAWIPRDNANPALELNGIDAGITYPGLDALGGQTSFTVAAWVKVPSLHSAEATLLQQQGSGPNGGIGSWLVRVTPAGTVGFGVFGRDAADGNEGHQFDITSSVSLNDGQWHHVACVRDGETGRIFIDGVLQGSGSGAVRMLNPEHILAAGRNVLTGDSHLAATLDDIRIYTEALGAPQIIRIAGTPKAGILSPLAASADIPPGVGIMLTATGSDPDGPVPSFSWSMASGPGTVNFGTPAEAETSALFSQSGTYLLRVTASDGLNSETREVTVHAGVTASSPFVGSNYGAGTAGGHFSTGPDSYVLDGYGANLLADGTSDGFYLLGQNFTGDFDLRARLGSVDDVIDTDNERAGLMVRAGTAGDADEAGGFIGFDVAGGLRTLIRASSAGANSETLVGSFPLPQWCRITRVGTEIKLWHSEDGEIWTSHATFNLTGEIRAGLCWSSGSLLEGGSALFEKISGFSIHNLGPSVDAGEAAAVVAGFPATLDGFVTDDGFPDPPGSFGVEWSLADGPAAVILDDAIMAVTNVNCQAAGDHVMRLIADDGGIRTFDDVVLTATIVNEVSVTATDSEASETGPDTGTFTITRDGSLIGDLEVSFTLGGTADNGDDFGFVPSPISIPAGETSATITITPIHDNEIELPETVILTINPGDYDILGTEAEIVITDFNLAPEWASSPLIWPEGEEGTPYSAPSLATAASDPNGDDISFAKISGPDWLEVAVDGSLSGTPGGADAGLNGFSVRVTDSGGLFADEDLEIVVDFINQPPVFSAATLTPANAVALIPYSGQSLADFASDPNSVQGDLLTYAKLSGPSWIEVAADGTLSGTAANEDIGFTFLNVRVTDAGGMFANATVQIVVAQPVLYLDTNGPAAGSGASAAVTWDSSAIWSTSAAGDGPTYGWADGALAVFSAGDDAIASAITVDGSRLITGFIVEVGEPSLVGGTLVLGEVLTEFMITGKAAIGSTIAGVGNGIFKSGDGTLELSGNHTFNGAVMVSSGALILNGSLDDISGLTLDPGATLAGGGSVGSAVEVGGVLSPGDGVGTLAVGALGFTNDARLDWQAGDWSEPATGHDLLTAASLDLTDVTGLTIALDDEHLTEFSETSTSIVLISCLGPIIGFDEESVIIDATEFPSAAGTWEVRVDGNDLVLDYTPPPPFELWLLANFGPEPRDPLVAGEMADPDHDAVPNLVEYALGTDPNLSGPAGYVCDLVTVEGIEYLRITITRNPAATDVSYTVQTTGNLTDPESWTDLDTEIITDTPEELIVRDTLGGAKRFIRLRVSR